VARVVGHAKTPERTLKRRFKQATGLALIDYVQNLRIEEAKHLLESSDQAVDEICFAIGYEDPSFFRRLFKRRTGVAPARYRRVFQPIHRGMPPHRGSEEQHPDRTQNSARRSDGRAGRDQVL
jgi:transcriptional regulator GlxA family with amidase domain